ncbi:hypothetical protein [Methylobacterium sp. J-070]|nr:hypothetical protein [Methylobacterium sp. J-070]
MVLPCQPAAFSTKLSALPIRAELMRRWLTLHEASCASVMAEELEAFLRA